MADRILNGYSNSIGLDNLAALALDSEAAHHIDPPQPVSETPLMSPKSPKVSLKPIVSMDGDFRKQVNDSHKPMNFISAGPRPTVLPHFGNGVITTTNASSVYMEQGEYFFDDDFSVPFDANLRDEDEDGDGANVGLTSEDPILLAGSTPNGKIHCLERVTPLPDLQSCDLAQQESGDSGLGGTGLTPGSENDSNGEQHKRSITHKRQCSFNSKRMNTNGINSVPSDMPAVITQSETLALATQGKFEMASQENGHFYLGSGEDGEIEADCVCPRGMATSSILTNTTTSDFLASDGPDFDDEDGEVDYIDELDNSIGSRGSTGSGGRLFSTNMTNSGSVSAACANATSTALNSSWMQQIMDRSCNPELRALLNRTARAVDYKLAFGGDYSLASPLSRANGGILYANAKDVKNNEPYSEEKQSNIILAHMKRSASQGNFLATASLSGISSDIDKAIVKKYQDENCMISANVRSVGVTANASLSIDPLGHNLVKLGIPVNETNKVDSGLLPSKNIEAQPSQTTTWARKRGSRESLTRKQTGMDAIAFVPPPSECFSEESHADKMPNMTAWKVMKQAASSNLTTWSELKKTARRSKSTDIQHAVDGHQSRLDQHKLNIAFGHVSQEPESKVEVGETFMPNNLRSRSQPTSIDMHRFSGTLLEIFMRARAQDMLYSTLFDAKQRRPSNASGRHSSAASPSLHELAILAGACDLGPTHTDACSTRPRGWFDGLFSNNSLSAASTHAVSSSPANFVPKIQQPLITSYNLSIRAPTRANVASSGAIRPCSNFGAQFPPLDATGKALLAASGGSLLPGPPRGFPIFAIAPGLTTGKRASGGVYYPTSSARHPIIRQARPLSTNALGSGGGLSAAFQPLAPQQATGVMASFSRRRASQGGFQPNSPLATGLASNSLGLSPSLFTRPLVSCLTASAGPDSACMTALRLGVHPHHYAHPATAAGVATGASTMAGLSSHCFGGVGTRNPRAAIAYPGVGLLAIPRPSRMTACAFLSHTLPDLSFLGQAAAEEDRKGTPTMPKRMEVSVTETPSFAPNRPAKFNKPAQPPCQAESLSPAASAGCHHVCQKCGGCSRSASASASHLATTNTSSSSSSLVASGRRASRPSQTVSVGPRRSQPAGRVPTSSIVEASDRNKALETATISAGELQDKPESENLSGGLLVNERYRSFPELALAVAGTSGEEALQDCNRLAMIEHRTPCRAKFDGDSMLHSDPIKVSHFNPFDANCIILLRINH